MINALGPLFGQEIHVSVGNQNSTLGAYAEFSGVLGPWEAQVMTRASTASRGSTP
jgi:hypothetical protein